MRSPALLSLAWTSSLIMLVAACTPPPSPVLAVRNDSDAAYFVRLEGAGGRALDYRVDPGAAGRALAPGDAEPATTFILYGDGCDELMRQDDPSLGSLDIGADGSISTSVGLSRLENVMPVLPLDDSCS